MTETQPEYRVKNFPLIRRLVVDSGRIGKRKRSVMALLEVDVPNARRSMSTYKKRGGESLSFSAFFVSCLGKALDSNPIVHARRDLLGRIYLFRDTDCALMVEIEIEGEKFPLAHVLRGVNNRSFASIHEEVRMVKKDPSRSDSLQTN